MTAGRAAAELMFQYCCIRQESALRLHGMHCTTVHDWTLNTVMCTNGT